MMLLQVIVEGYMMTDANGKELLEVLSALANPQRLRIVAALGSGRNYVSQLARDLAISRPLLHLHLQKLEAAGLVRSSLELSDDGKAMRFFELEPFRIEVTLDSITRYIEEHPELGQNVSKEESTP
jgi:DNA-binding transcriptional ArsR family regulator